jgi:histidine triad (HIT) family protein
MEQAMTARAQADCIFCRIARGELGTTFVAENESAVAFRDIQPHAPTHVLVVPRRHIASLNDLGPADASLASDLLALSATVARQEGIADTGYRVLINTGPDAGQTVSHLHIHVMGGHRLSAGLG